MLTPEKQAECVALVKEISENFNPVEGDYTKGVRTIELIFSRARTIFPMPLTKCGPIEALRSRQAMELVEPKPEEPDNDATRPFDAIVRDFMEQFDQSYDKRVDGLSVRLDDQEATVGSLRIAREVRRKHVDGRLQAHDNDLAHQAERLDELFKGMEFHAKQHERHDEMPEPPEAVTSSAIKNLNSQYRMYTDEAVRIRSKTWFNEEAYRNALRNADAVARLIRQKTEDSIPDPPEAEVIEDEPNRGQWQGEPPPITINPCPFCGEKIYLEWGQGGYVMCRECSAKGPRTTTPEQGILAWNRVSLEQPPEPDKAPIEARLQAQAELAEHWEERARELAMKFKTWDDNAGDLKVARKNYEAMENKARYILSLGKSAEDPTRTYRVLCCIEQMDASGEYVASHDDPTQLSTGFTNLKAAQTWVKHLEEFDAEL